MKRHPLERKVLAVCREKRLFPPGSRVTVALSGGPDSMALLTVLLALREELRLDLSAAHFHHHLRGAEADRDRDFVQSYCAERDIPLRLGEGDVAAAARAAGQSVETAARRLRYAFFETLVCDRIATAHTADDNTETVLLRLIRGTGPRGLTGIPVERGRFVRPLLSCTKAELMAYLREKRVPFVTDGTNEEDGCRRNRLRHHVIPLLLEENPALHQRVRTLTETAGKEEAFLSRLAGAAKDRCRIPGGLSCAALRAEPEVLRRRVLLGLLEAQRLENPSFGFVTALERLAENPDPSARLSLPKGLVAFRQYDLLGIRPSKPGAELLARPLAAPGETDLGQNLGRITCFVTKSSEIRHKSPNIFYANYDMITQDLQVRPRLPGDRLRRGGGGKSLTRLMIDYKIPAALRDSVPVLTADGTVFAVPGIGIDPAYQAPAGQTALAILYTPGPGANPDKGEFP